MDPNAHVVISISSPSSTDSRDDGRVNLRVQDEPSGTVLVDVEIPAGRWWRLCQSTTQHHPAFVSPNLDRVGKVLETNRVRWDRDDFSRDDPPTARDVYRAVTEQLPEDWHDYADHSAWLDRDGWVAAIRRWVDPTPTTTED